MNAPLQLYHGLASTCSKKVRLCLYEKGLRFESHLLDLQKFEQHRPEYLRLNPNGVVPTLVHEGKPIIESNVIIEYLDDCFFQNPLSPEAPYDRAQMRLWMQFSEDTAYQAVYAPTWQRMRSRAQAGLAAKAADRTLAEIPTAERRERWLKMAQGGFSEAEIEQAYDRMRACLARIDNALAESQWLAGRGYSLADIAIVPFVDRIRNLRPDFFAQGQYSHLQEWYARIRARPALDKAFNFKDDPRASELPNL